tara:strand:+ start:113 stop:487 length:375 start_codon:yes stop_codon:yes gene_type:complete
VFDLSAAERRASPVSFIDSMQPFGSIVRRHNGLIIEQRRIGYAQPNLRWAQAIANTAECWANVALKRRIQAADLMTKYAVPGIAGCKNLLALLSGSGYVAEGGDHRIANNAHSLLLRCGHYLYA